MLTKLQRAAVPLTASVLVGGIALYPTVAYAEAPQGQQVRHLLSRDVSHTKLTCYAGPEADLR